MVPEELRYTAEHEWIAPSGEQVVRVGITDYAQSQLGDVVFVQLPDVGATVSGGAAIGEVESTKSVSDIYAPIAGEVVGRNDALDSSPELVNSDPYGAGWMFEIKVGDAGALDALLNASDYRQLTAQD